MSEQIKKPAKKRFSKTFFLILVILFLLLLVAVSMYFFLEYRKGQELLKNPTLAAQAEAKSLVAAIGSAMLLPTDEEPTIATVSDVDKLKDQVFFKSAKNGFKVLIYTKAKKAILYDPINKKIIEVGPINVTQANEATEKENPVRLVLYNGSTVVGLTKTIETQLKGQIANLTVVDKQNAKKSDYTKTLVVDLTGKQKAMAAKIASLLQGSVATLPAQEEKPTQADIVVILAKQVNTTP